MLHLRTDFLYFAVMETTQKFSQFSRKLLHIFLFQVTIEFLYELHA